VKFRLAIAATLLVAIVVVVTRGVNDGVPAPPAEILRRIDMVALVESVNVDTGWEESGGRTTAAMRLSLDDLRTLTIPAGTLTEDRDDPARCTSFDAARSCVLLADMLGEAVVWFVLVPADRMRGAERLTLPGLVDMRDNGNEGVLRNGWVVPLASPVRRECGDIDTAHLRDFITRFPHTASRTVLDLTTDSVVRVECA
jgi:hypothetical protein